MMDEKKIFFDRFVHGFTHNQKQQQIENLFFWISRVGSDEKIAKPSNSKRCFRTHYYCGNLQASCSGTKDVSIFFSTDQSLEYFKILLGSEILAFNWQFDEELRVITHSCHSCVMKKPMAEKGEICQVKDIGSNYACVLQSTDAFAH